jgi:hypothetical protein
MSNPNLKNDAFLSDLTDGRERGNWESRYDENAQTFIKKEKLYLIWCFITCFLLTIFLSFAYEGCITNLFCVPKDTYTLSFAFLGGFLGGTLYSMKWLIHSVGKNNWNRDRHLWRILTPLLSAAIALLFIILLNNDYIPIEKMKALTMLKVFGVATLVGYFSDNAIGKLAEVAQVLFGASSVKSKDNA